MTARLQLRLEPLLLVAALLSVLLLGWWTRQHLRHSERYLLPVAAIDCAPPPAQVRTEFLAEVQYLANLPEQLNLLDDGLTARLATAFARHPWVETVQRIQLGPARQIRVWLHYRVPVLALAHDSELRAVDGEAILLPSRAATQGLPRYTTMPKAAPGPAGTRWPDPRLQEAAAVARLLAPQQGTLRLVRCEATESGLTWFTARGTRIIWKGSTAASGAARLERLLHHCREHGDLDHPEGVKVHELLP